ncbi:hypothetical protein LLG88_13595 [bacterium]|nr:hypothetical protein [bacterium]
MGELAKILAAGVKNILLPIIEQEIAKANEPTLITRDMMDARLAETGAYERMANATLLALLPPPTEPPAGA